MRRVLAAPAVAILAGTLAGHVPITTKLTWNQHIAPIVRARCAACHRDGGAAFSLLSYEQARPWAKAIKEEVLERRMPPGSAVKGFGDLAADGALTQEEVDWIANWVEGGAPEGDAAFQPADPAPAPVPAAPGIESSRLEVTGEAVLDASLTISAVEPVTAPPGGSIEVIAYRPDGSVVPLLWLRGFDASWRRAYSLREKAALPEGTLVRVYPEGEASAALLVLSPAGPGFISPP